MQPFLERYSDRESSWRRDRWIHRRAILVFGGWSRWQRLQLELCMGDIDVNKIGREKSGGNQSLKPS
jgi:hypothetical protein